MKVSTLPATVFKILGMTIILLIIFDTTLVLVDTITVHSRMTTLAGIMQNEVARNNSMPDALGTMFTNQINEITTRSNVAVPEGTETNINGTALINGRSYPSIAEGQAKGTDMVTGAIKTVDASYGDLLTMVVGIRMNPRMVFFRGFAEDRATTGFLGADRAHGYTMVYEYTVPCLRYTK